MQVSAIFIKWRQLIWIGAVFAIIGSIPEYDISLPIGSLLGAWGLWHCLGSQK